MINPRAWIAFAAVLLAMAGAYFYLLPGPNTFKGNSTTGTSSSAPKPKAEPRPGTATSAANRPKPAVAKPTPPPPMLDERTELLSLIARAKPSPDTEYQHMSRAIHRLQRKGDALPEDPEDWFDLLAEGKPEWERAKIEREAALEVFDRIVTQLRLEADAIGPEEYKLYARRFLAPKESPPWKPGETFDLTVEAERVFVSLDRDRNGTLSVAETQEPLRSNYEKWAKADGAVSRAEYIEYFVQRHREILDEELAANEIPLPHTGKELPKGFPRWFVDLDLDEDGQVGLYEWRLAWKAEEFAKLDTNHDGFITPDELRHLIEGRDLRSREAAPLINRKLPPEARKAIAAARAEKR